MIRGVVTTAPFARGVLLVAILCLIGWPTHAADEAAWLDIERKVTHGFATNNGVRIHYARLGQGPLVVMIHGLSDKALGHAALNGNWEYVDNSMTLVTVPDAGHWVQQDAAELVTRTIVGWLKQDYDTESP